MNLKQQPKKKNGKVVFTMKPETQQETQEQQPKEKVATLETLKAEITDIKNVVVAKAKENSNRDIRINYALEQIPKDIDTAKIKAVTSNYDTQKASVTFYRGYINDKVAKMKGIDSDTMHNLESWVRKESLYQYFNLWVAGSVKSNKSFLF